MKREPHHHRLAQRGRSRQRGVVLIFTLIVLLILTIGAVALMRSMNTALSGAGNLAFRRDLVNQGEQAVANVIKEFKTGDLSTSASTLNNVPADNYSATMLDRMCSSTGTPTGSLCVQSSASPTGGTAGNTATVKPPTATVYRLSVRVTGARNTQVFLQTTFTRPD
jgi:Tfp pilus assembly protein PilX